MNLFQSASLIFLACMLASEALNWRRRGLGRFGLIRILVWSLAAAAIFRPQLAERFAQAIGIGRGADVVLYLFSLAFVAVSFYFYARLVELRRELTALARVVALLQPRRGAERDEP